MKIHYTLDDSAARLPLSMRSVEQARDRATDLRNSSGAQLVGLATQHMLGTSASLTDELIYYFEHDATPTEADPYELAHCYAHRAELEDLLRDMRDLQPGLVRLHEVAELFPITFRAELQFTLALTVAGCEGFGYVRTFADSEGDEFHGMVVNLAHARPHVEQLTGDFSRELLVNTIRHGFFNHEGFLLAYEAYATAIGRSYDRGLDRIKHGLISRGIAWYLSYRHDLAYYDSILSFGANNLPAYINRCNVALSGSSKKRATLGGMEDWPQPWETHEPGEASLDIVGYYAARAIAAARGDAGLRDAIVQGPDHFIRMYNEFGDPPVPLVVD